MADLRSPLVALGAVNAAVAVAAGAFGAHALRTRLDARALEVFETAARYQMFHALGMIAAGMLAAGPRASAPPKGGAVGSMLAARGAGWVFQLGIVLFCGSLYALALSGVKGLGAVTPLGGVAFLVGWLWLAWTSFAAQR